MSFESQDCRSHPRVRRFGGDLFGSRWGVKIDESAKGTVVLLSQFGGIGFRVLNQIGIDEPDKAMLMQRAVENTCTE